MELFSKTEGGGATPEEELNIPSFVLITNTSGFDIPASVLNRAWISLSNQIANRNEAVVRAVDENFFISFLNNCLGYYSALPVTADTMTSFADKVYAANVDQDFTAAIIPPEFWGMSGYQALRSEHPIGTTEGFIHIRIWAEGFENEGLSSDLPVTPFIYIGTTFGQTVWATDFLYQRMKAHSETITKLFTSDPEALQVWQDSVDTLSCKTTADGEAGEAPIIFSTRGDLRQFVTDNYRFLIQTCLNNDTQECIKAIHGSDPKFPNYNNVSKVYYGLEVIPFSSPGFSRLEPVMHATKHPKAKAAKNKRRRAKRKTAEVVDSDETKPEGNLDVSTKDTTKDETPVITQVLEDATSTTAESSCDQEVSRIMTQSENQTSEPTRIQTISHDTEPAGDAPVSVTSFAGDAPVSVTPLPGDKPISVTSLAGDEPIPVAPHAADAPISVTPLVGETPIPAPTVATTGTRPAKNAASLPTSAPAGDTSSSQTAAPARSTSSSQTPAKDAHVLQATAPLEAEVIHRPINQTINADRARVIAELRAQSPPPSLEEARARRASIKEERRQSIEFIRKRTSSRASALAFSASTAAPKLSATSYQGVLEQVPESTADSAAVGNTSNVGPPPALPLLLRQPAKLSSPGKTTAGPDHLDVLPCAAAQENVKPKRGKWIAPLPEQQEWRTVSQPGGTPLATSSVPEKKRKKNRGEAVSGKALVQSGVSVGTQTETGVTACSVGTQTEIGVATAIAEDLETGAGPVPGREDESAGCGPPPSLTSRASLQRELELTSIVEDPAFEQDCGGRSARGRLTMAAPSTPHASLVAELRGAGVPPSALTSLSRSGLEANEATGCRQQPVGIRLEVETVTVGGVTFETPGRYESRHRVAASMPKLELDW